MHVDIALFCEVWEGEGCQDFILTRDGNCMETEVFSCDCFSICCQIGVKLGHLEDNKKIHVNVEFLDEWSYFR